MFSFLTSIEIKTSHFQRVSVSLKTIMLQQWVNKHCINWWENAKLSDKLEMSILISYFYDQYCSSSCSALNLHFIRKRIRCYLMFHVYIHLKMPCFVCTWKYTFVETQFTFHKIHLFDMQTAVIFVITRKLHNYCHNLMGNIFIILKRNITSLIVTCHLVVSNH